MADLSAQADQAVTAFKQAMAKRPRKDDHAFSRTLHALAALRDAMVKTGIKDERLHRVNAVISVVWGGEYSVGSVPWDHLESAFQSLDEVVAGLKATAPVPAD
jgi:hypothetical protein